MDGAEASDLVPAGQRAAERKPAGEAVLEHDEDLHRQQPVHRTDSDIGHSSPEVPRQQQLVLRRHTGGACHWDATAEGAEPGGEHVVRGNPLTVLVKS